MKGAAPGPAGLEAWTPKRLGPFKVGDFIAAGGVTGVVHEIGLFVTTFDTPDNVKTYVGNSKIFSDTIQNYSVNPVPPCRFDGADRGRRRSTAGNCTH